MDSPKSDDLMAIRAKNIKEKELFLASMCSDSDFANAVKEINAVKNEKRTLTTKVARKKDTSFRFSGLIPKERRSSSRLKRSIPEYSYADLPDEKNLKALSKDDGSLDDLEEVVYKVNKRRPSNRSAAPSKIVLVEDVTPEMISNVAASRSNVNSGSDTSCHQCRQKTASQKTICRSGFCVGVRGQFCDTCMRNRYGEDTVEALLNPNWKCFVCRGICNCSFCRARSGKRPTGILAPLAKRNGYTSVQELLASLKGYGDYTDLEYDSDEKNLLGFKDNVAVFENE